MASLPTARNSKREGEGRRAVAVGVVDEQFGYLGYVELHALLARHAEQGVVVALLDVVEQLAQLLAQERRDDGWRCLVGPKAVGVGGTHDAGLEQRVVAVNAHQGFHHEGDEAQVLLRRLARGVEQCARVGAEAPVVVLARAVDAGEGLLVQQHAEAVLARHLLHERHEQHVVVVGDVGLLEDGGYLKLVRRHLVVARLARYGQLQGAYLQVLHEGLHAVGYGAEVVVVHLLVLGRVVAHERAAGEHQVGAGVVKPLVDEEVLLLPAQVAHHLLHGGVEVVAHLRGRHVHRVERAQQRRLVVERLAGVGYEDGGYAERVVHDEHGRGGIPGRVAPCLERVAYAAAGEARGVGLLLHEQLARELLYHASLAVVLYEGVVLLGRAFRKRLEPVRVVRGSVLLGPLLHAFGHGVGYRAVEAGPVVNHVYHGLVNRRGQVFVHLGAVEHVLAEILRRAFGRRVHLQWLLAKGALYYVES